MKARTKAKKRNIKRGRPRIPDLDRTADGRIRRTVEQTEKRNKEAVSEMMAPVMEVRKRIHGATSKTAMDENWGFVLGRIFMDGNLGLGPKAVLRLEAGKRYAIDAGRYYGLTGIPFPSPRAQDMFALHGFDGDETEERAKAAREASNHIMKLEGILLRCPQGRQVSTVVKSICVMDIDEARGWPSHMHELLRCGLDALAEAYGLQYGDE